MPIAVIHLLKGRTEEQRKAVIESVTAALVDSLDVAPKQVRVILQEMAPENFGVGGIPFSEQDQ